MLPFSNCARSANKIRTCITNYVSFRRKTKLTKPFWLGTAKSKIFRIPPPKPALPENEAAEKKRIMDMYDRHMRALQNFMSSFVERNDLINSENIDEYVKNAIEESLKLNDEWNAESARLREERQKREAEETEEVILKDVMLNEEKHKLLRAKVEEIVRNEIEQSGTFITEQNLDSAIESCLSSSVDHNYAIDLDGNVYMGTDNKSIGNLNDEPVRKKLESLLNHGH